MVIRGSITKSILSSWIKLLCRSGGVEAGGPSCNGIFV